ncbi:hypothetical protein EVAR_47698_1 [Eumeta japonica]|uniref:Uncharacterized protein n=1 Tax=Eumeta variegata TaxID=151549 RepID=A0A4C1XNW9_EUMVA|nr:hypothetical protein EVAR_47698_1 [Eumeta japonica]
MRLILVIVLIVCLACRVEPKGGLTLRHTVKWPKILKGFAQFLYDYPDLCLTIIVVAVLIGFCSCLMTAEDAEDDAIDVNVEFENQEMRSVEREA